MVEPALTVCALPGCPELTRGNYCPQHAEMTEAEEAAEIRRLERRRRDLLDEFLEDKGEETA